jgi:FkbM family methyltransferase
MLKAIAKKTIRHDYWLFVSWYRERFGFLPAIGSYIKLLWNSGFGSAPGLSSGRAILLRPGTTDQDVYEQVIIGKEYDIDLGSPSFIVDAGAHIGLTSIVFASKYSNATVVAIEPEPSNFALLLRNTRNYPNIKPVQAGLWCERGHVRIQDHNVNTWSFRVCADDSRSGIPSIGIQDILSDFKVKQIDVLKIDIEGSEVAVLTHAEPWIDAVKTIVIELHDRFQPGCSNALRDSLIGHAYDESMSGENVVITNLRRIAAS